MAYEGGVAGMVGSVLHSFSSFVQCSSTFLSASARARATRVSLCAPHALHVV